MTTHVCLDAALETANQHNGKRRGYTQCQTTPQETQTQYSGQSWGMGGWWGGFARGEHDVGARYAAVAACQVPCREAGEGAESRRGWGCGLGWVWGWVGASVVPTGMRGGERVRR